MRRMVKSDEALMIALVVVGVIATMLASSSNTTLARHGDGAQGTAAQGKVENVQSVIQGGIVQVMYDLVAEPGLTFTVTLEVSRDGGANFDLRPKAVSGDVGPGVRPGTRKQIRWEASQELERLDLDFLRYRIRLESPPAPPPAAPPASAPKVGTIIVTSIPRGARILVDGTPRGQTPLPVEGLQPGDHRVVLQLEGHLEHSRTVHVEEGRVVTVEVTLTPTRAAAEPPAAKPATPPTQAPPPPQAAPAPKGGGGATKWVLLGVGGAGAAAAAVALGGGGGNDRVVNGVPPPTTTTTPPTTTIPPTTNRPPVVTSVSSTPDTSAVTGIDSITVFTIRATATDPDGDALTFTWTLGDGTTATGPTVTKTYTRGANFTVQVTVNDGRGGTAQGTLIIRVASMTGTWRGTQGPPELGVFSFTLTQTGTTINGTYTDSEEGPGRIDPAEPGRIDASRNVTMRVKQGAFTDFTFRGTLDASGTRVTGGVFGSGFNGDPFTITKQ